MARSNSDFDVSRESPAQERDDRERLEGELAAYRTYLGEMSEDLARARELLFRLVGDQESACRLGSNGSCLEHHSEAPCTVREARLWLGYDDV